LGISNHKVGSPAKIYEAVNDIGKNDTEQQRCFMGEGNKMNERLAEENTEAAKKRNIFQYFQRMDVFINHVLEYFPIHSLI